MKQQYTILILIALISILNQTSCQQQEDYDLLEQGIQDPVNYNKEIEQATLNLSGDHDTVQDDMDQWLGNYHVGSECESHKCERYVSELFNFHNQLQCPKSENSGVIGYSQSNDKLFLSLYAYQQNGPKKPFIATFDKSSRVRTREGYKYTIRMTNGFDIHIEPCHYGFQRHYRFNKCPFIPLTPTLIVYKTDQGKILNDCSFTLTRYYGQPKESCHKKKHRSFFNHLAHFGKDVAKGVIKDATKAAVESVIFA